MIDDVHAHLWMDAHPEAKEIYLSCDNALEQDRCIAAITIAANPELKNQFHGLDMNELSYENVIMNPYNAIHSVKTSEQLREEEIREMLSKYDISSVRLKSRIDELESKFGHLDDDCQQDDCEYD